MKYNYLTFKIVPKVLKKTDFNVNIPFNFPAS